MALCTTGDPGRGHGTCESPEEGGMTVVFQEPQSGQDGGRDDEVRRKWATSLGGLHEDTGFSFERRSDVMGRAFTACLGID